MFAIKFAWTILFYVILFLLMIIFLKPICNRWLEEE